MARLALTGVFVLGVAACSTPGPGGAPGGIHDPYEQANRARHAFNRDLDSKLLRPVGTGYSGAVPDEIEDTVSNFADNLSEPSNFVNNILQGNIEGALINTVRFVLNSTLGFAGLADVASDFGIREAETDFGQTLHVWGVPEGAYVELPLLGPSTERDVAGKVVDLFTNPLSNVLPKPERYYGTAASALSRVGDRGRFANTIDSVLYDSADSYAQARLIYLQSRRFKLGQSQADAGDPYATDPYALGSEDPYADPYAE